MLKGYSGKILHVDLSQERFFVEEPDEKFYRKYLGGSTLGAYYLMKGMDPKTDPLSEENMIVFSVGPFTGAAMSGASRHAVTTKSPLTNTIAASEAGGYWAPELKFAGFDAVVIKGKAKKPVYLWVHDGEFELRDASKIWGKITGEAQDIIREELGDKKIRVAQIGPAGENLVKYANIVNELAHFNGRNGMGAVMGSKNLRAIAVRGTHKPDFHDSTAIQAMAKRGANRVRTEDGYMGFKRDGTNGVTDGHMLTGGMPTRNWTSGTFEGVEAFTAENWNRVAIKPGTCYACAQSCKRHVDGDKVKAVEPKYGGPEYETVGICGSNLGIADNIEVCKINEICSKYAMDTISFGGTVSFIMECFENGVITTKETDGLELNFGNAEAVIKLAEMTGKREGFGNLVAEGSMRLAELWGEEAKQYVLHVKGKEFPAHMPQVKASLGLAYATVPFGADHVSSEMDPALSSEPLPYQLSGLGFENAEDPTEMSLEKSKLYWKTQIIYSVQDTVCTCVLAFGLWTIFDIDDLTHAVNHATGWKMTFHEVMMVGERRLHMMKAFNAKVGFGVEDDVLPEKMFKPLRGGITDGVSMDKEAFFQARDQYYDLMGWDKKTGIPNETKLRSLNLEWVADYINN